MRILLQAVLLSILYKASSATLPSPMGVQRTSPAGDAPPKSMEKGPFSHIIPTILEHPGPPLSHTTRRRFVSGTDGCLFRASQKKKAPLLADWRSKLINPAYISSKRTHGYRQIRHDSRSEDGTLRSIFLEPENSVAVAVRRSRSAKDRNDEYQQNQHFSTQTEQIAAAFQSQSISSDCSPLD